MEKRKNVRTAKIIGAVFSSILRVIVIVALVLVIYKGAMYFYDFGYRVFKQDPMTMGEGRTVTVTITEDMSLKAMGQTLLENGLIEDTNMFAVQFYLSEFQKNIKPGIYELSTSMTVEEMLEVMAKPVEEKE